MYRTIIAVAALLVLLATWSTTAEANTPIDLGYDWECINEWTEAETDASLAMTCFDAEIESYLEASYESICDETAVCTVLNPHPFQNHQWYSDWELRYVHINNVLNPHPFQNHQDHYPGFPPRPMNPHPDTIVVQYLPIN